MKHHVRKVCIDDPRLSDGVRKLLRAALTVFAKAHAAELSAVIELYEHGFLKIRQVDGESGFYVELCTPEDAPQLRADLAFETGQLS
jgi:hypothetical protein